MRRRPAMVAFSPAAYEEELSAILAACREAPPSDDAELQAILRRHPKDGKGFFSKSELIRGLRYLCARGLVAADDGSELIERLRMKPVRTRSGVAPVTVLTQPFPCPGRCVFCPSDVRQPKSYVSSEPGAQRAAQHRFDPYVQTWSRLLSLWNIGHPIDKIELIILGGTWTAYPEAYRLWFVTRCFEALADFDPATAATIWREPAAARYAFDRLEEAVDGRHGERYNEVVARVLARELSARPAAGEEDLEAAWRRLARAHRRNEQAACRSVGLSLETRPDEIDARRLLELRRLGATKIQLGIQSLDDEVLRRNRRGHDVAATCRATALLRSAGFKIQAHWMPNLYGSTPEADVADFERLFSLPEVRPDELKIYPCSLLETAELMVHYESGAWRPYSLAELETVLERCLERTPPWCRVTRVVRDIPSTEIVAGNRITNLRERVEARLARRESHPCEVRSREIGREAIDLDGMRLAVIEYEAGRGTEAFLQFVTAAGRLAGFLRLALPLRPSTLPELGSSAVIREVHVYGQAVELGASRPGAAQHSGLGSRLVEHAAALASARGYESLAVISAVGTRPYYRRLGFRDGELYQNRDLRRPAQASRSRKASSREG